MVIRTGQRRGANKSGFGVEHLKGAPRRVVYEDRIARCKRDDPEPCELSRAWALPAKACLMESVGTEEQKPASAGIND